MAVHMYDIDIAQRVGVAPAVLYYNIRFWIEKNAANDVNLNEGRYWSYNSAKAFAELFPERCRPSWRTSGG